MLARIATGTAVCTGSRSVSTLALNARSASEPATAKIAAAMVVAIRTRTPSSTVAHQAAATSRASPKRAGRRKRPDASREVFHAQFLSAISDPNAPHPQKQSAGEGSGKNRM